MRIWERNLPVGAEVQRDGGTDFRVWAPQSRIVEVVIEDLAKDQSTFSLESEGNGYFRGMVQASAGESYRYRLDRKAELLPDPASRFQPTGPFGPSQIVDPQSFEWSDGAWKGLEKEGQVLYELHVGTFSKEGTWGAAVELLPRLQDVGITAIELMPVCDFAGEFGWGYDGVNLYAPTRLYGNPDGFRSFVNKAHGLGLGVILDIVYNHVGIEGNFLGEFASDYFTDRYKNDWGKAFNFDGERSESVREFFLANVAYWVREFHIDGFRLDAFSSIHDSSKLHIITEIVEHARNAARMEGRKLFIVAEHHPNRPEPKQTTVAFPVEDAGCDAVQNWDFQFTAQSALTGNAEAYLGDHKGTPQELISLARWGYVYYGQWAPWAKSRRGVPAYNLPGATFVNYLENHDEVANTGFGSRIPQRASPRKARVLIAVQLLWPGTPMLFQGQEFGSTAPFLYFADVSEELREKVQKGRIDFLSQFTRLKSAEVVANLPDPCSRETFELCKLDPKEFAIENVTTALHRDLLRFRRKDQFIQKQDRSLWQGAVLSENSFLIRFLSQEITGGLLMVINLGRAVRLSPAPEPLLAPPLGCRWKLKWSSEEPKYGGEGAHNPETDAGWLLQPESFSILIPEIEEEEQEGEKVLVTN